MFLSTFLRFLRQKDFASCGTRRGLRPFTPPPFEKGRRVPVEHKQGADRSGSEDLDENFTFILFKFTDETKARRLRTGFC